MNVYLVSQPKPREGIRLILVIAPSEQAAREMHPLGLSWCQDHWQGNDTSWAVPSRLRTKCLGAASMGEVPGVLQAWDQRLRALTRS
jgi:hypothetical protein